MALINDMVGGTGARSHQGSPTCWAAPNALFDAHLRP